MVRLNTPSPKKREDFSNTEDYIKHLEMQVEWRRMKDAMIEIYKKMEKESTKPDTLEPDNTVKKTLHLLLLWNKRVG